MTKVMKTRKSGFTLVELLIVIMIIAILAGMLLLATGAATDSAEATKIINDLRNLKAAWIMMAAMNFVHLSPGTTDPGVPGVTPAGVGNIADADLAKSLDLYMDRPFFNNNDKFTIFFEEKSTTIHGEEVDRKFLGFTVGDGGISDGVQTKLKGLAENVGLYCKLYIGYDQKCRDSYLLSGTFGEKTTRSPQPDSLIHASTIARKRCWRFYTN